MTLRSYHQGVNDFRQVEEMIKTYLKLGMHRGMDTILVQNVILQRPELGVTSFFFRVILMDSDVHDGTCSRSWW